MADIIEIIKNRHSIRKFKDKEIPENIISKIIEALKYAPSAGNIQSRKFYFVTNKDIKDKIGETAVQSFIREAPLVMVCCAKNRSGKYRERGKDIYSICDVSASIQNALLVISSLGLGACWVGSFDEFKLSAILRLSFDERPIAVVPIGYPDESPLPQSALPEDELIKKVL